MLVGVDVLVEVGRDVFVAVGDRVRVAVSVGEGVNVSVGAFVGVAVGAMATCSLHAAREIEISRLTASHLVLEIILSDLTICDGVLINRFYITTLPSRTSKYKSTLFLTYHSARTACGQDPKGLIRETRRL